MKLLVVMVNYPFPARVGSAIVAVHCMEYLARRNVIDLICHRPSDEGHVALDAPIPEFINRSVIIKTRPLSKMRRWLNYIAGLITGVPDTVSKYTCAAMSDGVQEMVRENAYDAILVFEMGAIQYCPESSYRKIIVNIEDPQSIKLHRLSHLSIFSVWWRFFFILFSKAARRYEMRVLPLMRSVVLLSRSDMEDLSQATGFSNLEHLSYGVTLKKDTDRVPYSGRARAIVYSGSMYHLPNVDGALYLLNEVYPEVLKECPDANLWVVGADPDGRIYEAARRYGSLVSILANVDDISKYVKLASVSVCPVRLRIGVQTKILEAMSWGTPVVSTGAGNRGIDGVSGVHLWVEDDPAAMASRVCELLRGQGWSQMADEGWMFVRSHFSWEHNLSKFERRLESFVENS